MTPSDLEKGGRRKAAHLARKAKKAVDRENAAQKDELGPLFAAQAEELPPPPEVTEEMGRRIWQMQRSAIAEGLCELSGVRVLDGMSIEHVKRLALRHIPADVVAALDDYVRRVYPDSFWLPMWMEILAGKRVVLSWRRIEDPSVPMIHVRLEEESVWPPDGWTSSFTADQVRALLAPTSYVRNPEQPDDGGTWERFQTAMMQAKASPSAEGQ